MLVGDAVVEFLEELGRLCFSGNQPVWKLEVFVLEHHDMGQRDDPARTAGDDMLQGDLCVTVDFSYQGLAGGIFRLFDCDLAAYGIQVLELAGETMLATIATSVVLAGPSKILSTIWAFVDGARLECRPAPVASDNVRVFVTLLLTPVVVRRGVPVDPVGAELIHGHLRFLIRQFSFDMRVRVSERE